MTEPDPCSPALSHNPAADEPGRWTPSRQAEFLRQLVATKSVSDAATAVGMSRQSAYRLRARLKGQPFDIAWEAAFQHCYDDLAQAALERAMHGVEVPVFHAGAQIGSFRKYDERLTCFLLSQRSPTGAQKLGRFPAPAEFWSRKWDEMLDLVEHGPQQWPAGSDWPYAADLLSFEDRETVDMLERKHS